MNSPLCYAGGKSRLAKTIIEMMPGHHTYCEVFAGAAWVFFKKPESRVEVINDLDSDLVCFYRVLQHHLEEFLRQFKWLLTSREFFEDFKRQQDAGGFTDIQRAARYYYLQRLCYGGRPDNRAFGAGPTNPKRVNLVRMEEELSLVHLRLARVVIENLPWRDFVQKYDRPTTAFYIDPPYFKAKFYKHNFNGLEDFQALAELLAGISGKFILSINDVPEMREVFGRFTIKPVGVTYSLARKSGKELLITNYNH